MANLINKKPLLCIKIIAYILLLTSCESKKNANTVDLKLTSPLPPIAYFDSLNSQKADTLIQKYQNLLQNDISLVNPQLQCTNLYGLGAIYLNHSKREQAKEYFLAAEKCAEHAGLNSWQALCLVRISMINYELGDENLALKQAYESLALFEKNNENKMITETYNLLGGLLSAKGEFNDAEKYLNKALELNIKNNNSNGINKNKNNLAFLYINRGENEKGKKLLDETIPELIKNNDELNLASVYSHISLYYQWQSKSDSSILSIRKSIYYSSKNHDSVTLSTYKGMLGMLLKDLNLLDSAKYYLMESYHIAANMNDYFTQRQALQLVLSIDSSKKDYRAIRKNNLRLIILNDSIDKQNERNNIETSRLKYQNENKANELAHQAKAMKDQNKQNQLLLILLILSTVIFILLIIQIKLRNLQKHEILLNKLTISELERINAIKMEEISKLNAKNLEQELKLKELEQLSNAIIINQKNTLLTNISSVLIQSASKDLPISISEMNEINTNINLQLKANKKYELFIQKFNSIHPDFFSNLVKLNPNLTKSEIKFCAYLKLRFSSHQIAIQQNVTYEAIRKTRYRLRKKLNLPQEKSLEEYISAV